MSQVHATGATRSGYSWVRRGALLSNRSGPPIGARVFDVDGDSPGSEAPCVSTGIRWWFEEDEPICGIRAVLSGRCAALTFTTRPCRAGQRVLAAPRSRSADRNQDTEYYIRPADIRFRASGAHLNAERCPYKGRRRAIGLLRGDAVHRDLAWTYHYPLPAVAPIAGLVAFYNEKVDLTVDVALPRPASVQLSTWFVVRRDCAAQSWAWMSGYSRLLAISWTPS